MQLTAFDFIQYLWDSRKASGNEALAAFAQRWGTDITPDQIGTMLGRQAHRGPVYWEDEWTGKRVGPVWVRANDYGYWYTSDDNGDGRFARAI